MAFCHSDLPFQRRCAGAAFDVAIPRVPATELDSSQFQSRFVNCNQPVLISDAIPAHLHTPITQLQSTIGDAPMTNVFASSAGRFLFFKRTDESNVVVTPEGVRLERKAMTFEYVIHS
jgi:hypothetical protein